MPSILPAAIVGAGAAGAIATTSAAKTAAKASQQATDQSLALQKQMFDATRASESPFVQAGYQAVNALTGRMGLDSSPVANAITTANQTAAGANGSGGSLTDAQAQQLLNDRPDVMAAYQKAVATADPNSPAYAEAGLTSPLDYARNWYSNKGGSTDYTLPGSTATPAATTFAVPSGQATLTDQAIGLPAGTVVAPNKTGVQASPPTDAASVSNGSNNPAAFGQTNALTGQPSAATLTGNPYSYGNAGNPQFIDPGFNAPAPFSYTLSDYKASPAYQWQVGQALQGVQNSAAAHGSLYSGDTLKALSDRAENMALTDFGNERNFALGNYQDQRNYDTANYDTNRAFAYQNYADQRNYLTNQANTQTANLFNLSGMGQNAASNTGAAGQNYANTATNALTNNAANQANAGIAGANSINSLLGSGVNALGRYAAGGSNPTFNFGGSSSSAPISLGGGQSYSPVWSF